MTIYEKTNRWNADRSLANEFYTDAWQHFQDELCRLNLKISYLLLQKGFIGDATNLEDPLHHFKGFVITKEETERLLSDEQQSNEQMQQMENIRREWTQWNEIIEVRKKKSTEQGIFLPLAYISEQYQLSIFEEHCLLVGLAVEMDRKYEKIFAYLQDDVQQKSPTVDLAINLHFTSSEDRLAALEFFVSKGNLMTYFFSKDASLSAQSLLSRKLQLEERITRFLLHVQEEDEQLLKFTDYVLPTQALTPLAFDQQLQQRIQTYLTSVILEGKGEERNTVFFLKGREGSGKSLQVKHVCNHFNQKVLIVDLNRLLRETDPVEIVLNRVFREAILQQGVLCFTNFEAFLTDEVEPDHLHKLTDLIKRFHGVVFLLSEKSWKPLNVLGDCTFILIEIPLPSEKESEYFWEELGQSMSLTEVNWGNMASKFRFTPGQIVRTIQTANSRAGWTARQNGLSAEEEIVEAAYEQVKHKLEKKATRIIPSYTWQDVVLPEDQKDQMRMACNQVKHRHIVFDQWGFHRRLSYGKGVSMLFSGPPGTGKTMAAEVIAKELLLEVYKIDLSQVISKYIGETEKNLSEIFGEAQYSNAILFFDETDALFGKRSEVNDSKDKYANIEVAYLLQKMEEYQGVTVLATNLLQNIDEAFMRRINYVIKFPFPDAEYREKIWRSMFPAEAPLSEDIDFNYIAEKLQIAGGNIKNIALSSAFLAADAKEDIHMKHIIKAARHELQKTGKILLKEDFEDFWD